MARKRRVGLSIYTYPANGGNKHGTAQGAYDHNSFARGRNADERLINKNDEIINRTNNVMIETFLSQEYEKLREIGTMEKAMRKDAIGTISVVMEACNVFLEDGVPPKDFDMDGWVKSSMDWVDRRFNAPNHEIHYIDREGHEQTKYHDNIYYACLHLDETSPHIHVMIMPIDERGRLNSGAYLKGPENMLREYQSDYAKSVEEYGLERGIEGCRVINADIRRYHKHIIEAMDQEAPHIIPGETIEEYKKRADESVVACHCHMAEQDREHERDTREIKAGLRMTNRILGIGDSDYPQLDRVRSVAEKLREYDQLEKALDDFPDRDYAGEVADSVQTLIEWQRERELLLIKER